MSSVYRCSTCNKWFEKRRVTISCTVLHPEGQCCHEFESPAAAPLLEGGRLTVPDDAVRCGPCDRVTPHRLFGHVWRCSECGNVTHINAITTPEEAASLLEGGDETLVDAALAATDWSKVDEFIETLPAGSRSGAGAEEALWSLDDLAKVKAIQAKIDTMPEGREHTSVPCDDLRLLSRRIHALVEANGSITYKMGKELDAAEDRIGELESSLAFAAEESRALREALEEITRLGPSHPDASSLHLITIAREALRTTTPQAPPNTLPDA